MFFTLLRLIVFFCFFFFFPSLLYDSLDFKAFPRGGLFIVFFLCFLGESQFASQDLLRFERQVLLVDGEREGGRRSDRVSFFTELAMPREQ